MSKRMLLPFLVSSCKELWVKHLQSSTPKAAIIRSNQVCFFSNPHAHVHVHTQGDGAAANEEVVVVESVGEVGKGTVVDTAWDATKKTAQTVIETTTAEADTNVVDTVEYRSAEDLMGQLGDGCDNKIDF